MNQVHVYPLLIIAISTQSGKKGDNLDIFNVLDRFKRHFSCCKKKKNSLIYYRVCRKQLKKIEVDNSSSCLEDTLAEPKPFVLLVTF